MRAKSSKNIGRTLFDLETSETLDRTTSLQSNSSAVVFPVKTCPTPGEVLALRAREAVYGSNSRASFARFDPDSSLWKTSQLSAIEDLALFSVTWPRSGMMRFGLAFQLPKLALRTSANGCLSLVGINWPTLTVHGNSNRKGSSPTSQDGLLTAVNQSVSARPTLTGRDWRSSASSEATRNRNARPLNETVRTETEREQSDASHEAARRKAGPLNPEWCEILMGFPPGWTAIDGRRAAAKPNTRGNHHAPPTESQTEKIGFAVSETQSCRKPRR